MVQLKQASKQASKQGGSPPPSVFNKIFITVAVGCILAPMGFTGMEQLFRYKN